MEILFVHGAGGWPDDQPLADALRESLGVTVSAPRFPDDDMSAATWRRELDRHRASLGPELVVVGHSFGASIALLHLADDPWEHRPVGLALLAMPFWGPEGWDVPEYAVPAIAAPLADIPTWLHHCRDDEEVPIDHLDHHVTWLPHALVRRHESGGHQFDGRMAAVADDLRTLGAIGLA